MANKLASRELICTLKQNGWQEARRTRTTHIVLVHPNNSNVISFPRNNKDLGKGLIGKIKRLAGI